MLDPRLYRRGLIVVVLGVIVFAFSLQGPPAPLAPNLAPDAYSASAVTSLIGSLARRYPLRSPGSRADRQLAGAVARALGADGFAVQRRYFTATTALGRRVTENVIATRAGLSPQTIVVVAPRDYSSGPPAAELSPTAVLLELGQVLGEQSHQDTITLASTSASAGGAGTAELARQLEATPVDAVIVLGDLARRHPTQPIVVPWSDGRAVAPLLLRRTLAAAIAQQSSLRASTPGLPSQLAHGALPMTISPQGPFGARNMPAVLLSAAGERGPTPGEAVALGQAGALGAALLDSVDALARAPRLPAPTAYLMIDGQSVPAWAVRLLVLTLILPVLALAVDAAARARRRGAPLGRALGATLAWALPALVCLATIRAFALGGAILAPPDPTGPGAARPGPAAIALLALLAVELVGGLCWLAVRSRSQSAAAPARGASATVASVSTASARAASARGASAGAGSLAAARGPALLLAASLLALAIWSANPLAALLLVPALHLWAWISDEALAPGRPAQLALLLAGLLAPGLLVAYYALADGFSLPQLAWSWLLMLAAGRISLAFAVLWSLALGCFVSATVLAARARHRSVEPTVRIRGPLSYAGPGSLGGTESALHR